MSDDPDHSGSWHELDVTLWIGKAGVESTLVEELETQLEHRDAVKIRVLQSARAGSSTEQIATELAESVDAEVYDTRGHTAVIVR